MLSGNEGLMPVQVAEEAALVGRCISGSDPEAWEAFVGKYGNLLWSSIHRTFGLYHFLYQDADAEDVFNSVILSLLEDDFRKLRQFRGYNNCSLSTWLTVVAGRKTIDFIRSDKGKFHVDPHAGGADLFDSVSDKTDPSDILVDDKRKKGMVAAEVMKLVPRDRIIYHLLFNKGLEPADIARFLGISAGEVHSRKYRITERLKIIFKDR